MAISEWLASRLATVVWLKQHLFEQKFHQRRNLQIFPVSIQCKMFHGWNVNAANQRLWSYNDISEKMETCLQCKISIFLIIKLTTFLYEPMRFITPNKVKVNFFFLQQIPRIKCAIYHSTMCHVSFFFLCWLDFMTVSIKRNTKTR